MTYETVLTLDGAEHSYAQANGLVERKKNRIRQEVDKILFSATGQELAEPSLSSVRDRIKSQINDLLDNEEVLQVDFAEFRKYEMPHTQEND